jgi:hypothetical protein
LSFHNFRSLQKELSEAWKGWISEELVERVEVTTLNACRDEDLESQQKKISNSFF